MPQVEAHRSSDNRRRRSVFTILACLVVVGAVVGYIVYAHMNAIRADNQEFNYLTTDSNLLMAKSSYSQAAVLWISYAGTTHNQTHKQMALQNAAALYLSGNQFSKALAITQQAESNHSLTFAESEAGAYAAVGLGQNQTAIHYYQAAIRLVPSDLSDRSAEIDTFNQAIKQLQAKS